MAEKLIIGVKQGEAVNIPFVIKADGVAMDLAGLSLKVEVKNVPRVDASLVIPSKTITETSDNSTVGQITNASGGEFEIRFNKSDTSLTPKDYYLVIYLLDGNQEDIISADGCLSGIYRICVQ